MESCFPDQGLNPDCLQCKCGALATGPPGKSQGQDSWLLPVCAFGQQNPRHTVNVPWVLVEWVITSAFILYSSSLRSGPRGAALLMTLEGLWGHWLLVGSGGWWEIRMAELRAFVLWASSPGGLPMCWCGPQQKVTSLVNTACAPWLSPSTSHSLCTPSSFILLINLFLIWGMHCEACGILVPWPGMNPRPLQWKHGVFTTGPPGNSHTSSSFKAKGQRQQLAPGPCTVLTVSMHPAHTCLINLSINSPPIIPTGVYLYFPVGKQQAPTAHEDFKWYEVGPGAPGT